MVVAESQQDNNKRDDFSSVEWLTNQAVKKHKEGQIEEAIAFYSELIQLDECQPDWVYGNLITLLAQINHVSKTLELGSKALKIHSNSDEIHRALGIVARAKHDLSSLIDNYQQAIKINQDQPSWVYCHLIESLIEKNQLQEAIKVGDQGCKLYPQDPWIYEILGQVWEIKKDWHKAIFVYFQAQEIQVSSENLDQKIARCLQELLKLNLSQTNIQLNFDFLKSKQVEIDSYTKKLSLNPEQQEVYLKLGNSLAVQRNLAQAALAFSKALKLETSIERKHELVYQITTDLVNELKSAAEIQQPIISNVEELQNKTDIGTWIVQSGIFDEEYYLHTNQDAYKSQLTPVKHFLDFGASQGYRPHAFFDTKYYLKNNPEVTEYGVNPLAHYIALGSKKNANPNAFFDTKYYLDNNPEIKESGINPLAHYSKFGTKEGRIAWSLPKLKEELVNTELDISRSKFLKCLRDENYSTFSLQTIKRIGIYTSSLGNQFMTEIANFLEEAFKCLNIEIYLLSEKDTIPNNLDLEIIVAPHEFFYLGNPDKINNVRFARTILVNVEQPNTSWFAKSLHYLQKAKVVFDINLQSSAMLRRMGVNAYFLPLGYMEDYKPLDIYSSLSNSMALKSISQKVRDQIPSPQESLQSRPLDISFVGVLNQRREKFFIDNATWLSKYKCFWHIPPAEGPLLTGQDRFLDQTSVVGLSRLSKIILNIHRDELPYFEWHRIVFYGLWQKTLVLTEPCYEIPGLIAGEHYIESLPGEMNTTVNWLLRTKEGMQKAEEIRHAGHRAIREKFHMKQVMGNLVQILSESLNLNNK